MPVNGLCDTAPKVRAKVKGAHYNLSDNQAVFFTDQLGITNLKILGDIELWETFKENFHKPEDKEVVTGRGTNRTVTCEK